MKRQELIKVAELLHLEIKKNWASEKIKGLVDDKMIALNTQLGIVPTKVFKGLHPITGLPV